jgi:hypothetical protein
MANDGAERDFFGGSVAISGTTAIVGAVDVQPDLGSAYLFDTITGQRIAKVLPNDDAVRDGFGFSVGISGTTAIVGALGRNNERGPGAAYLFDTTTGHQIAKLFPNDGRQGTLFGWSVVISGTTAIVGDPVADNNSVISGAVYVFDVSDPANPKQIAKLLPSDGAFGDGFGASVAISGRTVIVGALGGVNGEIPNSAAYHFDISDPANPTQIAKLLPDDFAEDHFFGYSVAISGASAIVGAPQDRNSGMISGSAYLFDMATGQQVGKLLPDDGAEFGFFGGSVGISGTSAIVGARNDDDNGAYSGSAYLFDTVTGHQIAKILPSDGTRGYYFGWSVVISGTTAIVGAPQADNDEGEFSGAAYIFDTTRR